MALLAMLLVAIVPTAAVADSHDEVEEVEADDGGTVAWEGHGAEHLPCPDGIHWIFTAGDVDSATLTVNGVTYEPTKHVGAIHFITPGADSADELEAFVTYTGESQQGQMQLTISNCDDSFPVAEEGAVEVVKVVEGDDAPDDASFGFTVVCDDGTDESFTLGDGDSETVPGITDGAECTVTETDTGDADRTEVDGEEGTSTTVTVDADETQTVTFTNIWEEISVLPRPPVDRPTPPVDRPTPPGPPATVVPAGQDVEVRGVTQRAAVGAMARTGAPLRDLALVGMLGLLFGAGLLSRSRRPSVSSAQG